jgi:hypothetical protein
LNEDWIGRVFATNLESFRYDFQSRSFVLNHGLAGHPLFSLERLALAAERAMKSDHGSHFLAFGDQGNLTSRFDRMGSRMRSPDLIADLANAKSLSKLSAIDTFDPDYADLLSDALADLRDMSGRPDMKISHANLTVFMTSPNVITPFHIDHEANILSQISGGEKTFCTFEAKDRELLTLEEIESFYVNDINSAKYRSHLEHRGIKYNMEPGLAVCVPGLSPHWAKNGNSTSISLSLSLCLPELEKRARIHQVNYHLRKVGFHPTEPGMGRLDNIKAKALALLSMRHPKTSQDVVFSGVRRLRSPGRLLRRKGRLG